MKDTNIILQKAKKLVTAIGIDTTFRHTCAHCKQEYDIALPITGEFFGPSID